MANRFLNQLYNRLFIENFSYSMISNRLKMQKGIYLLQEMGVPVGDYRFSWYKHGPYSQSLNDDMCMELQSDSFVLTHDVETSVNELHEALTLPSDSKYSVADWIECLGSLHYFKENIYSFSTDENDLLTEFTKRMPHLNDDQLNKMALSIIEKLFSVTTEAIFKDGGIPVNGSR